MMVAQTDISDIFLDRKNEILEKVVKYGTLYKHSYISDKA